MVHSELYRDLVDKYGVVPDTSLTEAESQVILFDHSLIAAEKLYLQLSLEVADMVGANLGASMDATPANPEVALELARKYAQLELLGTLIDNSNTNSDQE